MNKTKPVIALLGGMNLVAQNVYRTGIEYLEKQFEVVVFDCRQFLQRPIDPDIKSDPRFRRIYQIATMEDFVSSLENLKPIYAIDFIGPCREMKLIQPALRIAGCKFVIQKLGQLPQPNLAQRRVNQFLIIFKQIFEPRSHSRSSKAKIKNIFPQELDRSSNLLKVRKITEEYRESKYFEKADIAVAAGRQAIRLSSKLAYKTLSVKSSDAHLFAQATKTYAQSESNSLTSNYVVFIDDAVVHATDWALLGQKPPIDSETYFGQLNSFFSQIERMYLIQVVIAGHPQVSDNSNYISSFAGRPVIFGVTPDLVLGCAFTIIHGSTAASFAVLAGKPIMVISNLILDKSSYGRSIRNLAKVVGSTPLMIDQNSSVSSFQDKFGRKYQRYIDTLLYERNTIETEPWDVFLSFINERKR
jgi:hypothetical protein